MNPLIYLACPYSHIDPATRESRFRAANAAANILMRTGHHVYSPISHTHPIAEVGHLPLGWDFWKDFDRRFLTMCDELWVLTIDGWSTSKGINEEMDIADELKKPIKFVTPDYLLSLI